MRHERQEKNRKIVNPDSLTPKSEPKNLVSDLLRDYVPSANDVPAVFYQSIVFKKCAQSALLENYEVSFWPKKYSDNVGNIRTTFRASFVRIFPTPLYGLLE